MEIGGPYVGENGRPRWEKVAGLGGGGLCERKQVRGPYIGGHKQGEVGGLYVAGIGRTLCGRKWEVSVGGPYVGGSYVVGSRRMQVGGHKWEEIKYGAKWEDAS